MIDIEAAVREALSTHAADAPAGSGMLETLARKRRHRTVSKWVTVVAAACVVAGPTAFLTFHGTSAGRVSTGDALTNAVVYGTAAVGTLTLSPPPPNSHPALSKAQAMSKAEQLTAGPGPIGSVSYAGLALVTADGGALGGFGPSVPDVRGELAWVFVYELPKNPPHHCPAAPPSPVASFPPLLPHYYSAIIVNAVTGQAATWQQDESGLLERLCAGAPVG